MNTDTYNAKCDRCGCRELFEEGERKTPGLMQDAGWIVSLGVAGMDENICPECRMDIIVKKRDGLQKSIEKLSAILDKQK